jgi:hypothetical protein
MNKDKRLEDLIDNTHFAKNELVKKIMNVLYKSNDALKVKAITDKVMKQDFSYLKESEKESLIEELSKRNQNEYTQSNKKINKENNNDDYYLKQLDEMNKKLRQFEEELKREKQEKENLMNILKLTSFSNLVEASDKDINELYIDVIKGSKIEKKGNAIFIKHNNKNIIMKSYYEF